MSNFILLGFVGVSVCLYVSDSEKLFCHPRKMILQSTRSHFRHYD